MDISSMLEVQVNEVKEADSKENVTPRDLHPWVTTFPSHISLEEMHFYKLTFGNDISAVRFRKLHCTACDIHIGSAPSQAHNMFEHPVLRTLLCLKCREFYGDGTFEQGDDATDMFCRWCANGGNLYCCSYCSNTFCNKCIKRNFDPLVRKKIEADEKWKCFVCNPADLYGVRAVCWALLQHVQSMTRALQTEVKMSPEEIEEKMNLDESQCCPRRRKRKRRRTGSNSEDEDETYIPRPNGTAIVPKRKLPQKKPNVRPKPRPTNGRTIPYPIRPRIVLPKQSILNSCEIQPVLFAQEQSMIKCENATVSSNGTLPVGPTNLDRLLLNKFHPNTSQASLYHANIMNAVAAASFLQSTSAIAPVRQVIGPTTQPNSSYKAMHSSSAPMVTIPNQSTSLLNGTQVVITNPKRSSLLRITPKIIEIDSDSDELTVVELPSSAITSTISVDESIDISIPAVPVALVSSGSGFEKEKRHKPNLLERRTRVERSVKTFNQRILPHGNEVDFILDNLKAKLQDLFEISRKEETKKTEVNEARLTIKRFHREIRNAVTQLAHVNDRMVREYNKWKRSQTKQNHNRSSVDSTSTPARRREVEIPLDMTCVNDSQSESDNCDEVEHSVISPSDLVGETNAVKNVLFFRKTETQDRGTGDSSLSSKDQSVQVYDVVSRDYEKCIGMSVLSKADRNSDTENNVPQSVTSKEHFGKYEEQFILYLQHIEDNGIETEDTKGLPDPNETPLKDLIEANSPFISEMLGNMDTSTVPTSSSKSQDSLNTSKDNDIVEKKTSKGNASEETSTSTSKRNVGKDSDDLDGKQKRIPTIRVLNESLKETNPRKRIFCTDEGKSSTVDTPMMGGRNSSKRKCLRTEINNEEDCTIIED